MKQNSENTEDLDRDQAEENNYMNGNADHVPQHGIDLPQLKADASVAEPQPH